MGMSGHQCHIRILCAVLLPLVVHSQRGMEPPRGRIPLHLIGLFPMEGSWPVGSGVLPAVNMALEDINNRPDLLPGYELLMTQNDTKCHAGVGIDAMYSQLYSSPTKIAILGPACSIVSEPAAKASALWNLVMMSYGSASPALSNKNDFPRFLRTQATEALRNPSQVATMKRFNWRRVATIHEPFPVFSKAIDDLRLRLAEENITLVSSEIISENPFLPVQNLKLHDARIIVVSSYEKKLVQVMCEAYKAAMYGSRYVWILDDVFTENWPDHNFPDIDCTAEQIYEVVYSSALMLTWQSIFNNKRQEPGLAGMNPQQFLQRYFKLTNNKILYGMGWAGHTYDALWSIALGLNQTINDLNGTGKGLEDFKYSDKEMGDLILKNIWSVQFLGVKGEAYFDINGDTPEDIEILQYRGTTKTNIGIYKQSNEAIELLDEIGFLWKDGVPKDATTFVTVQVFVRGSVYITICCFAVVGVVLAVAFLTFNLYFRKQRIIRMSSPVMNNVILVGCIVVYVTVFLRELSPSNVALLCKLRTVTIMVGFSLSFGALFAKTWRVYVIFTNTSGKKVSVQDVHLILLVGVLVLLDVIAIVLREVLDTPAVVNTVLEKEILDGGNLVVEREILACKSDYSLYFQATVFVYKGLLLIFGAFLAWQTRKVNIPALNDSQYIGMCVYNVTVLSILGVVLLFALGQQVELQYALVSAFIIFGTSIVQLTIFIPKVLNVINSKNRVEDNTSVAGTSSQVTTTPGTLTTGDTSKELEQLKEQLTEARKHLEEARAEVERPKEHNQELQELKEETMKHLEEARAEIERLKEHNQELQELKEETMKHLEEARAEIERLKDEGK